MRTNQLRSLLQSAVTVVMASPIVGCDSSIEDDPGFVTVSCGSPYNDVIAGLNPERAVEYLEIRSAGFTSDPAVQSGLVASRGAVCAGAADAPSCNLAFANAQPDMSLMLAQCVQICEGFYFKATRGDTVLILDNPADVAAFLGPIDTPQEAMVIVQMRGFNVPCGRGGAKPIAGGFRVQAFTHVGCDGLSRHLFDVNTDGAVHTVDTIVEKEANPNCVVGRRPAGLLSASACSRNVAPIVSYLTDAARLEGASILAFRQLARELTTHQAPRRLIVAARRAAQDEVRHTRVTAQLARRFGAKGFEAPSVGKVGARDLETIATENATEGCVRETFGAAVGTFQALRAQNAIVARAMRRIAVDETRHAILSWQVARWSERKLSPLAVKRVREARSEAVVQLRRELRSEPDASLVSALGVPSARDALALHAELERTLWKLA